MWLKKQTCLIGLQWRRRKRLWKNLGFKAKEEEEEEEEEKIEEKKEETEKGEEENKEKCVKLIMETVQRGSRELEKCGEWRRVEGWEEEEQVEEQMEGMRVKEGEEMKEMEGGEFLGRKEVGKEE